MAPAWRMLARRSRIGYGQPGIDGAILRVEGIAMPTGSGNRTLGLTLVISAALLWGTTGTIQALLPENREPIIVAAMRLGIGALTLLVLAAAAAGSRSAFRDLPVRAVIGAGVAIGVYNVMFFTAIVGAGVGIGTALAIGGAPVWVTLYEVLVLRRVPGRSRLLGQVICIAGAALLVLSGSQSDASLAGILIAALAGSAYGAYSVITSGIGHMAPATTIASATFGVAALLVAPAFLILPAGWVLEPAAWPKLIFLGVFATGISYALYTWGLRDVAASTAVTLALAEPLTAWLLAAFLVGEQNSATKIIGAALLLLGLVIVSATGAPGRATAAQDAA